MTSPKEVAEIAFALHERGLLTHEQLMRTLEDCVNTAALENGYADEHGLPFPKERQRRAP